MTGGVQRTRVELVGDAFTLHNIALVGTAVVVVYPAVYVLGWAWSLGYHRVKRRFVADMISRSSRDEQYDQRSK